MTMIGKKGVSIIIGYVLLVVIAIALSLLVYAWLKGYLPREAEKCPDSVSLTIEDYFCDETLEELTLKLRNRGLFNIDGYIPKISNRSGDLPTLSLKKVSGPIVIGRGKIGFDFADVLKPNEKSLNSILNYSKHDKIVEIEIIPYMYGKREQILCDNAVIRQELENCGSTAAPIP